MNAPEKKSDDVSTTYADATVLERDFSITPKKTFRSRKRVQFNGPCRFHPAVSIKSGKAAKVLAFVYTLVYGIKRKMLLSQMQAVYKSFCDGGASVSW